jgi:hypothetical protein
VKWVSTIILVGAFMFPNTVPMIAGPSAPLDHTIHYTRPPEKGAYGISGAYQQTGLRGLFPGNADWGNFMNNARPSVNIEDHRAYTAGGRQP